VPAGIETWAGIVVALPRLWRVIVVEFLVCLNVYDLASAARRDGGEVTSFELWLI
jgi:hypothetical protein